MSSLDEKFDAIITDLKGPTRPWDQRLNWYTLMAFDVVPLEYHKLEAQREAQERFRQAHDSIRESIMDDDDPVFGTAHYDA